jgi:hypothetical protein
MRDAVFLAGTTNPAPRETASLACAAPPSTTFPQSSDEGYNPCLDPTSPLSLLAQEVLDLLDQLRRVGSILLGRVLRLATCRVIVLLQLPDMGLDGRITRHSLIASGAKTLDGRIEVSHIQSQVEHTGHHREQRLDHRRILRPLQIM